MSRRANQPGLSHNGQLKSQIKSARAGSCEAFGQIMEECRRYLLLTANRELASDLRPKAVPSDLVQETFLEAKESFDRFHGDSDAELHAWLRQILLHRITALQRRYRESQEREISREVSLQGDRSGGGLSHLLTADTTAPSGKVRCQERDQALDDAVARLPDLQRKVLLLRHEENLSYDEIGRRTGRSADAARKLWSRTIERLAEELEKLDAAE